MCSSFILIVTLWQNIGQSGAGHSRSEGAGTDAMGKFSFLKAVAIGGLVLLGMSGTAPADAAVTYTFFDEAQPATVDLEFTVASQLSPSAPVQTMTDIMGVFASDFTGQTAEYLQGPPGHQPVLDSSGSIF
jgi:hypothetical protein